MVENKMYPIGKFAKLIGVSTQTLRRWELEGKLVPDIKLPNSSKRFYSASQLNKICLSSVRAKDRVTIGYCRVSSNKQKDDLSRQIETMKTYLISKGCPFEIVSDIGSGINYDKKGLNSILERVTRGEIDKIVVLYKDRLVRFGFELIENICSLYDTKIEVVDNTPKSDDTEFVEDIIQIITVYSSKLNGKRKSKTKEIIRSINDSWSQE